MNRTLVSLIGLINTENQVLISKRKNNTPYKNFWEFPGGKVEKGEKFSNALIREIKEELGLNLEAPCISPLTFSVDKIENGEILLLLFICRKWSGLPRNLEDQELRWVKSMDLNKYKMPPANIFLNSILRDWLSSN
tara:strand:- start:78 stop:485 length:408 start_codon:yes stop_codon:yes gene_type:complete